VSVMRRIKNVADVARWRLCSGCGACVPACPEHAIHLVDIWDRGIRPVLDSTNCSKCGECIKVCPGIGVSHKPFNSQTISELRQAWGPVLDVWEGYATDPEIRYMGSSGGVATALALYSLEKKQASGVLHIGAKLEAPLENVPVFSKNREELLAYTGSRYSPAAPCQKLDWIKRAEKSCVFIGKPCDVVALRKSQAVSPMLDSKVGLAISIVCAGTPTTKGTEELLEVLGVKPEEAEFIRYRGHGWPGMATVKLKGSNGEIRQMSYEESWGMVLSRHVAFRCRLCPDSTGEFADISCGDPWYKSTEPTDPGQSLVLVRTEKGRDVLNKAMKAGYVKLENVRPSTVPQSQKVLLVRRCHLWGRLLVMRMTGIVVPHYEGFGLFANWCNLSIKEKIRSVLGTIKRIIFRRLFRPVKYGYGMIAHNKDNCLPAAQIKNRTEDS